MIIVFFIKVSERTISDQLQRFNPKVRTSGGCLVIDQPLYYALSHVLLHVIAIHFRFWQSDAVLSTVRQEAEHM